jgi:hypothetical protein
MADGHVMLGWKAADATPGYIDNYDTSQSPRGAGPGASNSLGAIAAMSSATQDGQGSTVLTFALPLTNGGNSFIAKDGSSNIIFAQGPVSSPGSIRSHSTPGNRGTFNFLTGVSTGFLDDHPVARTAHGVLMSLAWGLFIPLGIISARYVKILKPDKWFLGHRLFVSLGLLLALVGWFVAMTGIDLPGNHSAHHSLGVFTMVLAIAQPLIAAVRPPPPEKGELTLRSRAWWELIHKNVGRIAYVCGIANCFLGLSYFNSSSQSINSYTVAFLVCWLLIIVVPSLALEGWCLYKKQLSGASRAMEGERALQPI